jgi:hypothetical protein
VGKAGRRCFVEFLQPWRLILHEEAHSAVRSL